MSAPAVIDSLEFAWSEQQLRGALPVASLLRLQDLLYDARGTLSYALRGERDERNRPQLALTVTGTLNLQCQRCLGALDYVVDVANRVLLVPRGVEPDEDLIEDPEAPDVIEASRELDVAWLIEDEVLLSLPFAPRHAEGACSSRLGQQDEPSGPKSAFAQLASLKRGLQKH